LGKRTRKVRERGEGLAFLDEADNRPLRSRLQLIQ